MNNIITLSQNNEQITFQRQEDGYINATALCKKAGKLIGNYLRNSTTEAFLQELEADMRISITELVQVQQGGKPELQGTWIHPQVAIHLSQWLSPKFAVQVSKWVENWIINKQAPQIQPQLPTFNSQYFAQITQYFQQATIALQEKEEQILQLENTVQEKEVKIEMQEKTIENAKELFNQVANKNGCVKFQMCARQLKLTDSQLRNILIDNNWRHKNRHFPTTKAVNNGFVKMLPEEFEKKLANGTKIKDKKQTFFITEKGFNELLNIICVEKI